MVKVVDDESLTKLRGGVIDVETFLVSRLTLGNRKTANSKSKKENVKWRWRECIVVKPMRK